MKEEEEDQIDLRSITASGIEHSRPSVAYSRATRLTFQRRLESALGRLPIRC